ncbi:MAG: hypothetical protein GXP41_08850 [Chloroflexi bacterium]|nr:hypothetical protein [Chloroflexota bacterium]
MARQRHGYYDSYYFPPTKPLEVKGGLKARSKRGQFAKNWWATRWIEAMERLVDVGRLRRGRSYARRGQVLSIAETAGGVAARVQGSRRTPYQVAIKVEPLTDAQWEKVVDALAAQALFTAQLLAGDMPADIEEAFAAAGVSLFPNERGDLVTDCSCPDWANPCKHVAATHYILGEQFDEDPFLLFRLRGRSQEQILEAMRQRRAGEGYFEDALVEEEEETVVPLEDTIPVFWDLGESLETFPVKIKPPAVTLPLLKRLGEPDFMAGKSLQNQLDPAYRAITRAALATAFEGSAGE